MKRKFILSLAAVLGFAAASQAQLTVKPTAGISITDFSKDSKGTSSKAKVGYQAGAAITYGSRYYVESGVFYSVKNTEFSTTTGTNKINKDALIKGIRVPLTVGAYVIGDTQSFLGVRAFGGGSGYYVLSTGKDVNKSDLTRMNWGAQAGIGVDVWKFFAEASYEWSLTNVQKDIKAIDLGKQRTIFIQAGFKFTL